ncbi:MAG: EAL domain-containing protein [Coriobacteriales bacterium]
MDHRYEWQDLQRLYDALPAGFCLVDARTERLLFANAELIGRYGCDGWRDFLELTGGTFEGMMSSEDYVPLHRRVQDWSVKSKCPEYCYVSFCFLTKDGHFRRAEGAVRLVDAPQADAIRRATEIGAPAASGAADGSRAPDAPGMPDAVTPPATPDAPSSPLWSITLADPTVKAQIRPSSANALSSMMGMRQFLGHAQLVAKGDADAHAMGSHCPAYFNVANFKLYNGRHGFEEGDRCLTGIGEILQRRFPEALVGHFSADSFAVFARTDTVISDIESACHEADALIDTPGVRLKAGIFLQGDPGQGQDAMSRAFDMAKIACDTVKSDSDRCWASYTKKIGAAYHTRAFVLEEFEGALAQGHIQVYLQPIIRTLSGKQCGLEALARWVDPQRGIVTPDTFIPVLERERLIHELDAYVIDQVGRMLRERMSAGRPVVFVSLNLSRLDFSLMDVCATIEEMVRRYSIPRELLRLEVTESALAQGEPLLHDIRRLRGLGYRVWLDDFGSAYSSLNSMQRYPFDALKIDMGFFRDFNESGRQIVASVVRTAKALGVHTLAEGVENEHQVAFLHEIGCEMLQGYRYGRPMRPGDLEEHLTATSIEPETPAESNVMRRAGLVNVSTGMPVALFLDSDGTVDALHMNAAFLEALATAGMADAGAAREYVRSHTLTTDGRMRELMDRAIASGRQESMTFVMNGQLMLLRLRTVAHSDELYVHRAELFNISSGSTDEGSKRLDSMLRNVMTLFDGMYYLDFGADEIEAIATGAPNLDVTRRQTGIRRSMVEFATKTLYDDDRAAFLSFMDRGNLYEEARRSRHGEAIGLFRMHQPDGSFRWKVFDAIVLEETRERDVLLCIHDAIAERMFECGKIPPAYVDLLSDQTDKSDGDDADNQYGAEALWQTLVSSSDLKLFWKDRDRRFIGASRAFLDFYGIDYPSQILGKTDEDLGWHIDPAPFRGDELAVLERGEAIRGAVGECLVNGSPHTIAATKLPVYHNGAIVGLVGAFLDLNKWQGYLEQAAALDYLPGVGRAGGGALGQGAGNVTAQRFDSGAAPVDAAQGGLPDGGHDPSRNAALGAAGGIGLGIAPDEGSSSARKAQAQLSLIDEQTGLLDYRGMLMVGLRYADSLRQNGDDYFCALLDVPDFDNLCRLNGERFHDELLRRIVGLLRRLSPVGGALARVGSCRFVCFLKCKTDDDTAAAAWGAGAGRATSTGSEPAASGSTRPDSAGASDERSEDDTVRERLESLADDIHAITEVDGERCTLYLEYAVIRGSRQHDFDGVLSALTSQLAEARDLRLGESPFTSGHVVFSLETFDDVDDRVVIVDPQTYEIVYLNRSCRRDLGLSDDVPVAGSTCYKVIEGYDAPCPFCDNASLRLGHIHTMSHRNAAVASDFLTHDTLIRMRGKRLRFAVSMDISKYLDRDVKRNELLYTEASINDAIAEGMQPSDPDEGIRRVMASVGKFLEADRFCIFEETRHATASKTYEWHRDGVALAKDEQTDDVPLSEIRPLYDIFMGKPVAVADDLEQFVRDNPAFMPHLRGVRNFVSGHLTLSGRSLGYTVVVNPSPAKVKAADLLLATITRFLAVMMRNRDTLKRLSTLSNTDQSTGVRNRRGLLEFITQVPDSIPLAVVFGDINLLKRINDEQGHETGDRVIRSVADAMTEVAGADHVFRIGGDEFLMIMEHLDRREAEVVVERLRANLLRRGVSVALGLVMHTTPIKDISAIVSEADRLMYQDKRVIHDSIHDSVGVRARDGGWAEADEGGRRAGEGGAHGEADARRKADARGKADVRGKETSGRGKDSQGGEARGKADVRGDEASRRASGGASDGAGAPTGQAERKGSGR